MPIYEYTCKDCSHEFEALVYGREKAECPKCHSKRLAPQLSVFAVAGKSGSSAGNRNRRLRELRRPAWSGLMLTARCGLNLSSSNLLKTSGLPRDLGYFFE